MTQSYSAGEAFTATRARSDTGTLFGATMALIAVTTGLFTIGAYLGRNLSGGWGLAFWIASLVCLMAMNITLRHSERLTLGMLFGFGLLVGLATAPAELILGVLAVRSWQWSLLTLLTMVGVWDIFYGVAEIFAAFSVRQAGRRAEHLLG